MLRGHIPGGSELKTAFHLASKEVGGGGGEWLGCREVVEGGGKGRGYVRAAWWV